MAKKTVDDIQVQGKRVLVRCSFSSSLAFSRFRSSSGFFAIMTRPAKNIGTNRMPISSSLINRQ